MAYTAPKRWAHGDTVSAANMQIYSDGLTAIKPMIGETRRTWAVFASTWDEAQEFNIVHKRRWLIYKSTGQITDPNGVFDPVDLPDSDPINVYDLDTVDWLLPGMVYHVIGCSVCMEDENGIMVTGVA